MNATLTRALESGAHLHGPKDAPTGVEFKKLDALDRYTKGAIDEALAEVERAKTTTVLPLAGG